MEITRFQIQIENGELRFNSPAHQEKWRRFLLQFEGKQVGIEIFVPKSIRTLQQNAYYWVYLTQMSEQTGHTKEDLHELFKDKFLTTGVKEIFGSKVNTKSSTTSLSVGKFVEYLMKIEELTGIALPDTTDYFGYSYHKVI